MSKILFCNIGWMNYYEGISRRDPEIINGGAYNENEIGHEVCNFLNCNGNYYGFVRTVHGGKINLRKIDGVKEKDIFDIGTDEERVDGITVLWIAKNDLPEHTIVGFYKNATVYNKIQKHKAENFPSNKHIEYDLDSFNIVAQEEDVFLIPTSERNFFVSLGNPKIGQVGKGQSNIWYASVNNILKSWKGKEEIYINGILQFRDRLTDYLIDEKTTTETLKEYNFEAVEGRRKSVIHINIDRNKSLVKKKKKTVLKNHGRLLCEACGFDFSRVYNDVGIDFCEVHHKVPLSELQENVRVCLNDLAILCSNCHRMIHRTSPIMSVYEFRNNINNIYINMLKKI